MQQRRFNVKSDDTGVFYFTLIGRTPCKWIEVKHIENRVHIYLLRELEKTEGNQDIFPVSVTEEGEYIAEVPILSNEDSPVKILIDEDFVERTIPQKK